MCCYFHRYELLSREETGEAGAHKIRGDSNGKKAIMCQLLSPSQCSWTPIQIRQASRLKTCIIESYCLSENAELPSSLRWQSNTSTKRVRCSEGRDLIQYFEECIQASWFCANVLRRREGLLRNVELQEEIARLRKENKELQRMCRYNVTKPVSI